MRMWLTALLVFILIGCGGKSQVNAPIIVTPPPKVCLVPTAPEWNEDVEYGSDLLQNYLLSMEYIIELESALKCYEGSK